jgi:2,3-bisphosphoglycerate-dependent phosphoglycerate mutase
VTGSWPYRLIVLRHGQSEWNAAGVFTGWANAYLTGHGEDEAVRAGVLLATHGVRPAFAHTSLQRRTIRTADLALAAADLDWIPVRRSWRLNGRHYGALQGRRKAEVLAAYGEEQFTLWRRSYRAVPPPLTPEAEYSQFSDARYRYLRAGGCVLVVSHGNTVRALVKHLENRSDEEIAGVDIPTGIPLVYELGPDLRPDALGGQYLDPHAARGAIEAIRRQGRERVA